MKLSDFDYKLPPELIAQAPLEPRDHSRLLVLDQASGAIEHKRFFDIVDFLNKGDVLVLNNSKVFPARLIGQRKESGGKLEIFLLRSMLRSKEEGPHPFPPLQTRGGGAKEGNRCRWQCLVGGRRARPGLKIVFAGNLEAELIKDNQDQTWEAEFNMGFKEMMEVVNNIGAVPLPPYVHPENRKQKTDDRNSYQTVYADKDKVGSVAAPTAGFHFTPELLSKIKAKGIKIEHVTLHVGLGTFAPVKTGDITRHKMHSEWAEIEEPAIQAIISAKQEKRRVIAVGTTSCRVLEAFFPVTESPGKRTGWVDIFIYPGYRFKAVDALITNFHLPKSTLLMLVSALAGPENIRQAYAEAISQKYRFFSYGDAMFIK